MSGFKFNYKWVALWLILSVTLVAVITVVPVLKIFPKPEDAPILVAGVLFGPPIAGVATLIHGLRNKLHTTSIVLCEMLVFTLGPIIGFILGMIVLAIFPFIFW